MRGSLPAWFPALWQAAFWLCAGIMAIALGAQGFILYVRDFVTPNPLPLEFAISDWIWLLLVGSFVVYFKKPIVTVVTGCIALVALSLLLDKFADDHSVIWFLYRHSLILVFVVAAQLGSLFKKRAMTARASDVDFE
jgi:hypothetical protein